MNIRKLATVAAAVVMAATVSAGACSESTLKTSCKYYSGYCPHVSSEQLQWIQDICKEYGLDCDFNTGCNKPETKPEDIPETQPETKPEDKPETQPDTKPEDKPETQPETKPEDKPETQPDTKPEDKPETQPDTKPEDKPETQPETKPEDKPETQPETKPEDKPETQPETKPEQTPDTDNNTSLSSFASQVVELVNAERAKAGLSKVSVNAKVQQAATVRAKEQAQSFSHTRPNGSSCFTALTEAGVNYRGAGENIAYGQRTPQEVMAAWMNSEGHRANILNAKFTSIGVGYTVINGTPYWAQMFTY